MSRTPILEHLVHRPEEVKKNAELFDAVVKITPRMFFRTNDDRSHVAAFWIETIRQNIKDGSQQLRLSKNMLPEKIKWENTLFLTKLGAKLYFYKFAGAIVKKFDLAKIGLSLPFNLVLKKDHKGYYVSRI